MAGPSGGGAKGDWSWRADLLLLLVGALIALHLLLLSARFSDSRPEAALALPRPPRGPSPPPPPPSLAPWVPQLTCLPLPCQVERVVQVGRVVQETQTVEAKGGLKM